MIDLRDNDLGDDPFIKAAAATARRLVRGGEHDIRDPEPRREIARQAFHSFGRSKLTREQEDNLLAVADTIADEMRALLRDVKNMKGLSNG